VRHAGVLRAGAGDPFAPWLLPADQDALARGLFVAPVDILWCVAATGDPDVLAVRIELAEVVFLVGPRRQVAFVAGQRSTAGGHEGAK